MPIQEHGFGQDGDRWPGGETGSAASDPGIPLTMVALALFVGAGRRPEPRTAALGTQAGRGPAWAPTSQAA